MPLSKARTTNARYKDHRVWTKWNADTQKWQVSASDKPDADYFTDNATDAERAMGRMLCELIDRIDGAELLASLRKSER
ncbi:hypothetical protein IB275_30310 [Pseudomonas sp. PDM21]|uniref:hypothetical protein n=1 Tax=Pseudomonas sp. PDM21 TaxID=2769257 RepID=UPI00177DD32A|nr:hypothetical protein [Pseudomonas sp. PDM21]MBD9674909.1 hypothetical protein [Pseudomonas sp. PDM21]